ncbi:unnamed protein product, partial [Mesorhabditis belari]|uniref:CUB domain-containing protein n=1 Tax=Mesorhabditis belari TaxID=2138241 RepID=A0AAF3ELP2_9BILA
MQTILLTLIASVLSVNAKSVILSEEYPSYAFHGVRLSDYKEISINSEGSAITFLIDYTQIGCKKTIDNVCQDDAPFNINENVPTLTNCNSVSFEKPSKTILYYCSFKIEAEQVVIGSVKSPATTDFALSIRVQEWVADQKLLLIPASTSKIPPPPEQIIKINSDWVNETCDGMFTANAFFSSFPSLDLADRYALRNDVSFASRTSAVTILGKAGCAFCLTFQQQQDTKAGTIPLELDGSRLSSYNYPWPLDDSQEFPKCQQFKPQWLSTTTKQQEDVSAKIELLEGGTLTFFTFKDSTSPLLGKCQKMTPLVNLSLAEVPDRVLTFKAECLSISFCPDDPLPKRFGFVMHLSETKLDPKSVTCSRRFTLTDQEPQAIFHAESLRNAEASNNPICISDKSASASTKGKMIAEISVLCYEENLESCLNGSPFLLNGNPFDIQDESIV